jgi:hypothetical protein
MIEINYIFSIGFRCYSPDFLKKYNLRKISGPFDYLFIDIETAFENIHSNFDKFLSDIVSINKNKLFHEIYYSDKKINNQILDFIGNKDIGYMSHNYNNSNLIINQNFIHNTPCNLYNWDRICIFLHHNITEKSEYDIIYERVKIFKNIYKDRKKNLCLLYITKIVETENLEQYKAKIYNLKQKYNINCYLILIICSDKLADGYIFENDILYIIKKVNDYNYQYNSKKGTDNNLNYYNEYNIISKVFNMELLEYIQIKSAF